MKRTKHSVYLRNKIADCAAFCDSCAIIEGASATYSERKELQGLLRKALEYIDKQLGF